MATRWVWAVLVAVGAVACGGGVTASGDDGPGALAGGWTAAPTCAELAHPVEPDPTRTTCGAHWLDCDGDTDACEVQVTSDQATCDAPGADACVWGQWEDTESGDVCMDPAGCLWCRPVCSG